MMQCAGLVRGNQLPAARSDEQTAAAPYRSYSPPWLDCYYVVLVTSHYAGFACITIPYVVPSSAHRVS